MKNLTFTNILLTEIGREIISYATFKKQKVNEKKKIKQDLLKVDLYVKTLGLYVT